jgi:tyrosyl-tRNA synthetase
LVHGEAATAAVEAAAQALFGQGDLASIPADVLDPALRELPHALLTPAEITDGHLPDIVDLLVRSGLASSNGQARRTIGEGGAYVNNVRVEDEGFRPAPADLLHGRFLVLRRGRKTLAGVIVEA